MLWQIDQMQTGLQNCVAIMHLQALPPVCSKYIAEFDSRTTGTQTGLFSGQLKIETGRLVVPALAALLFLEQFGSSAIPLLTRFQIQRVFQNL